MRIVSIILFCILIIIGITFATLNSESVNINYYVAHASMPLSLLLVLSFAIGGLLGLLVSSFILIKTKMQNHKLRHRLKIVEKEVSNLRAIPLQDKH